MDRRDFLKSIPLVAVAVPVCAAAGGTSIVVHTAINNAAATTQKINWIPLNTGGGNFYIPVWQ